MELTEHQRALLRALAIAKPLRIDAHTLPLSVDYGVGRGAAYTSSLAEADLAVLEGLGLVDRAAGVVPVMWGITAAGEAALGG